MSHTFLVLENSKVPIETQTYVPDYADALSNNGMYILIDGFKLDENGNYVTFTGEREDLNGNTINVTNERVIAHLQRTFGLWLSWSTDKQATLDNIMSTAQEYTKAEMQAMRKDPSSIWYQGVEQ